MSGKKYRLYKRCLTKANVIEVDFHIEQNRMLKVRQLANILHKQVKAAGITPDELQNNVDSAYQAVKSTRRYNGRKKIERWKSNRKSK